MFFCTLVYNDPKNSYATNGAPFIIQNSQLTKIFLLSLKIQSATLYALAIYQAMAQLRRKSQTRVYSYKRSRGTTAKTLAPPLCDFARYKRQSIKEMYINGRS